MVIIAGAGISKDPPSDLPSWSEYNVAILKAINELAKLELKYKNDLLDLNDIDKYIPTICLSDFVVRHAMGMAYFPLLEVLEGARPNNNHYALAQLAKGGKIHAIITTNFDTLIEQAFNELNVEFDLIVTESDFENFVLSKRCAILKIHGSVGSEAFFVDTITQKLYGLSDTKTNCLKKLFLENELVFMGYSGDDFLCNRNYLPIYEALKANSVTWLKHPKSTCNSFVNSLKTNKNFILKEISLREFFYSLSIEDYLMNCESRPKDTSEIYQILYNKMNTEELGSKGCLGLCIIMLMETGKYNKACHLSSKVYNELETVIKDNDLIAVIGLLYNTSTVLTISKNYDKALHTLFTAKNLINNKIYLINESSSNHNDEETVKYRRYSISIQNNIGICYYNRREEGDLDNAINAFSVALCEYSFIKEPKVNDFIFQLYHLHKCAYEINKDYNVFMPHLNKFIEIALNNYELILFIDMSLVKIDLCIKYAEYDSALFVLKGLEHLVPYIISTARKLQFDLLKAELLIRRNFPIECRKILSDLLSNSTVIIDKNTVLGIRHKIIEWFPCYQEHIDFYVESLLYIKNNDDNIKNNPEKVELINVALEAVKTKGIFSPVPLFLLIDFEAKVEYEVRIRNQIIYKEYFKDFDELVKLFRILPSYMPKEAVLKRMKELDYGYYSAAKRATDVELKIESALRYSEDLIAENIIDYAKKPIGEAGEYISKNPNMHPALKGKYFGLLSFVLSEDGKNNLADSFYNKSKHILGEYPEELRLCVFKRADAFARRNRYDDAFRILTDDISRDMISKSEIKEILAYWKSKYKQVDITI